jgi:hypothetical protein
MSSVLQVIAECSSVMVSNESSMAYQLVALLSPVAWRDSWSAGTRQILFSADVKTPPPSELISQLKQTRSCSASLNCHAESGVVTVYGLPAALCIVVWEDLGEATFSPSAWWVSAEAAAYSCTAISESDSNDISLSMLMEPCDVEEQPIHMEITFRTRQAKECDALRAAIPQWASSKVCHGLRPLDCSKSAIDENIAELSASEGSLRDHLKQMALAPFEVSGRCATFQRQWDIHVQQMNNRQQLADEESRARALIESRGRSDLQSHQRFMREQEILRQFHYEHRLALVVHGAKRDLLEAEESRRRADLKSDYWQCCCECVFASLSAPCAFSHAHSVKSGATKENESPKRLSKGAHRR